MEPFAVDEDPGAVVFNGNAKLAEAGNGGQAVRPLEEICNFCQTIGNGAKHNAPMGNGFITRDGKFPPESVRSCEFHS